MGTSTLTRPAVMRARLDAALSSEQVPAERAEPAPLAVGPMAAARMLSISRTTIYALLDSGAIPSARLGQRRLIPVAALQAWLDRQVALTSAADAAGAETREASA